MALTTDQAGRLASMLRELRESRWRDAGLTQAQLAGAFSAESRVAPATVSSWESTTNPKTPTAARLRAYARFFATRRSLDGGPHLIPESELAPDEQEEFHALQEQLLGFLQSHDKTRRNTFTFDDGPVTIICPEAPPGTRGSLADDKDPNFTQAQQFGDLDALLEIHGHLRAMNPTLDVFYRLANSIAADDVTSHVIVLGGIAWNRATRRFQEALTQVPVTQVEVPDLATGEIFVVDEGESRSYYPVWEPAGEGGERELSEDVGFLARLPNPFNISRTLTICNGIHGRGVYGAVRCLTDKRMRDANERYLAQRFPEGRFALLVRVPIVAHRTMSPDLENPDSRLYEWPAQEGAAA